MSGFFAAWQPDRLALAAIFTLWAPLGPSLRSWRISKMRDEADLAVRVANERF